jgi:hypothetical protein
MKLISHEKNSDLENFEIEKLPSTINELIGETGVKSEKCGKINHHCTTEYHYH